MIGDILAFLPKEPDWAYDWAGLLGVEWIAGLRDKMLSTPQHAPWHGEGDVWTHTVMVCETLTGLQAFRSLDRASRDALSLAALLHDIGKISATRVENGVIVSPHHASIGAHMARVKLWVDEGLAGSGDAQTMRESVCALIRLHSLPLHLWESEDAAFTARRAASIGANAKLFSLRKLCLLARADVLGRVADDIQERLDMIELSCAAAQEAGCFDEPYPFKTAHTARAYFRGGRVWPDQALYDGNWGTVTMMCGLPGTGKDTWIGKNCPSLPVVSLDDIRARMNVSPTDEQGAVVQAAKEAARTYLRRREPFVWNATSLTEMRSSLISMFEDYGAKARIVYLEAPWQENLRRNANRAAAVPENVIARMLDKLVPPQVWEAEIVEWK